MSRHGNILAFCVAAGLVAVVAGQSWDPMECTRGMQGSVSKYTQTLTGLIRELSNRVSQEGSSALNMEGFSNDANKLIEQLTSLTDTQQGFDANRYLSTYYDIVRTQLSMSRYFFNPSIGLSLFREYLSFTNKMVSANSDFLSNISSQCVPQNGERVRG